MLAGPPRKMGNSEAGPPDNVSVFWITLSSIDRLPKSNLSMGVGVPSGTANIYLNMVFCRVLSLSRDVLPISIQTEELFKRDGMIANSNISIPAFNPPILSILKSSRIEDTSIIVENILQYLLRIVASTLFSKPSSWITSPR